MKSRSEKRAVISNAGGFGPDFGQQHVLRYSNGAQIYSPVLGGFANFDAVLTFDEGYRIADPVNNGRLHSTTVPPTRGVDTHDVTHIKLKRGASSLVSAVLLPTCCESNRPTCNFCDLHAPDPAQCYVEGCCCKGHTLFERGECTDAFKTSLNYSCPQMNEFTEGGVLPSIALIVISFFNLAAGQSVNFYNRSYDRTPLRANSGNDVQSALHATAKSSRAPSRFHGHAVVDHDVLSTQASTDRVLQVPAASPDRNLRHGGRGHAIFQIGGSRCVRPPPAAVCLSPPPPPPPPAHRPPFALPLPTALQRPDFRVAVVLCAEPRAWPHRRRIGTDLRKRSTSGDDFELGHADTSARRGRTPCALAQLKFADARIVPSVGSGRQLLVNGRPAYQSTMDTDSSAVPQQSRSFFFAAIDGATGASSGTCS